MAATPASGRALLAVAAPDPAGTLDAYASLYLEHEVRAEGMTRNVGAFVRFLEAASFSHGALTNLSAMARECEVERKVAARYADRPGEIEGQALEGLVAQHLRAWIAYSNRRAKLYFWRTRAGTEVDFVVYGEDGIHAFEVKNRAKVDSRHLRPLRAFRRDYPEATTALLHRGTERLRVDGIWCMPVEEFLLGLVPERSLARALGAC